jgi:hypothetical protein
MHCNPSSIRCIAHWLTPPGVLLPLCALCPYPCGLVYQVSADILLVAKSTFSIVAAMLAPAEQIRICEHQYYTGCTILAVLSTKVHT